MRIDTEKLLDDNYILWKSWESTGMDFSKVFFQELKRSETTRDAHILEVGFGQGFFMDWAKANGYTVTGIEINRDMVDTAKKRGHDAHHVAESAPP